MAAALKGSAEIGFTIVSLSVSLIAVLIPLLFMGDIVGRLFREFAVTLSVAVMISLLNCNSPMHWDDRMLDSMRVYALANQPVLLTPFLIMGAMSPVSIPAALVQQSPDRRAAVVEAEPPLPSATVKVSVAAPT